MTKTQELEVVAAELMQSAHNIGDNFGPDGFKHTPMYRGSITLSAASATIKGLEAEIERLTRERQGDRRAALEAMSEEIVKNRAAEAERDALREQIKQAFLEGIEYAGGADFPDPGIAWARSRARKEMEASK